jgi:hypothetical protein
MRYTFSDDDEDDSDNFSTRRSARNSGVSTPAEHAGPTVTASGRHVKSRLGGMYGETILVDQRKEIENERAASAAAAASNTTGSEEREQEDETEGHPRGSGRPARKTRAPRRIDDSSDDEEDEQSGGPSSGNEWSGNEEEPDAEEFEADAEEEEAEEDEEMNADDEEMDDVRAPDQDKDSLVVQLRYKRGQASLRDDHSLRESDGDRGGNADTITVDSAQPAEAATIDSTRVNGEARSEEAHIAEKPLLQPFPTNGLHGASTQPLNYPEKAAVNVLRDQHQRHPNF